MKYAIGDKVYEVKEGNIFDYKICEINIDETISKFKEDNSLDITYTAERKVKVGILSSETDEITFSEGYKSIFSSKDEAIAHIEKVKEARELLADESNSAWNLQSVELNWDRACRDAVISVNKNGSKW